MNRRRKVFNIGSWFRIKTRGSNGPICLCFLFITLFLGVRTAHSNISADDAGFMYGIANGNLTSWINSLVSYVPGRNLHILWQVLIFNVTGTEMNTFWFYHALESASYVVVFFLVYKVLVKIQFEEIHFS